jgi:hypothetical protein
MAKRARRGSTTKTTTTTTTIRGKKGPATTTTTTSSTKVPEARRAPQAQAVNETQPKKKTNGGLIAGIILILIILLVAAYFLTNSATPAQQRSQFAGQLSAIQNGKQDFTAFYLANAPTYQLPVSQSWAVQVTDTNYTGSGPIGQLTISWNGQTRSFSVQNGIVNTGISPTYAVTIPHSEFMSFSQAIIDRDTAAAVGYYYA